MPIFKPEQTTEVMALSQLETVPGQTPQTRIDHGQMSAGRFQIHGNNIDDAIDTMVEPGDLPPDFTQAWAQHKQITDPTLRKQARQDLISQNPDVLNTIGARWTSTVQRDSTLYGYDTEVPRLMAHQNPSVTKNVLLEVAAQAGIVAKEKGFNAAQKVWPAYVAKVGREAAEKNLLEGIKAARVRDWEKIKQEMIARGETPPAKPELEPMYTRAHRMLTEPLANTKVPIYKALLQPNLPVEVLPGDLQKFFKDTVPGVQLPQDPEVVGETMEYVEKEKQLATIEAEAGEDPTNKLDQITTVWDVLTNTGGLTRASLVRALGRLGLTAHEILPEDLPQLVSGDEMLEIMFDYKAPKVGDVNAKEFFKLDPNKSALPQAIEFMMKIPEFQQRMNEFIGSVAVGEGVDVINLIGLGLVGKFAHYATGLRFAREQKRAKKMMEKINEDIAKRQKGINFQDEIDMLQENLARLTHLEGDALTRAQKMLAENPRAIEQIKALHPNTAFNDVQATLIALATIKKGDEILDFIHKIGPNGMGEPTTLAALKQHFREFAELYAPAQAGKTATGRGLEILKDETVQASNIVADNFIKTLDLLAINPEKAAQQLAKFDNSLDLAAFMKHASLPGWGKVYNEILVNGLLSGPLTLMGLNPLGNTAAFMMDIGQRQVIGLMGPGGVPASEAARMLMAAIGAVPKGLLLMAKTSLKKETEIHNIIGTKASKIDAEYQVIRAENFPNMPEFMKPALNWMGVATRIPTRLMISQDQGMKAIFQQAELAAQAGRRVKDNAGYDSLSYVQKVKARRELLRDMRENPSKYPNAWKKAEEFGKRNTFTAPGGEMLEAMSAISNSHPVLKAIFPFVRTPGNIMKRIATDLGYGQTSKLVQALRSGNKIKIQEATGRLSFAAMFAASIVSGVQGGVFIGGKGSTHPAIRQLQRDELGQDQAAFAFDTDGDGEADRFIGLNPRTHVGQIVNLIGQWAEARGYNGQPGGDQNFIDAMVLQIGDLLEEAPFLGMLGDFFAIQAASERGGFEAAMKEVTRMGATFTLPMIPGLPMTGVGFRKQVGKVVDPIKRDMTPEVDFQDPDESIYWKLSRGILNEWVRDTPSFSSQFIPQYSPLTGEPHRYPLGTGPFDYESDPTALQLMNTLSFPTNMISDRSAASSPHLELARWMVNNDVYIPKFPRRYQGIQLPNDLYQQWTVAFATGVIPDLEQRNEDGTFDLSKGRKITKSFLDQTTPLIRSQNLAKVKKADDKGQETTAQKEAVQNIINEQRNTMLSILLATDPHWKGIFKESIHRSIQPEPHQPSTPASRRFIPGIALTQ